MAYSATVPDATHIVNDDLSALAENFAVIRQFFMSGIIPVDGATISYSYSSGNLVGLTFGGSLSGSATFSYNANGDLVSEAWTVYGSTITVTYTYSSGNLSTSSISIT